MHYTIERLIEGDRSVVESFQTAKKLWLELFDNHADDDIDAWSKWITGKQHRFEMDCGGRWEGQEVMAWSGFGALYTTQDGFAANEAKARKLLAAFEKSFVSMECKGAAMRAAASYGLREPHKYD